MVIQIAGAPNELSFIKLKNIFCCDVEWKKLVKDKYVLLGYQSITETPIDSFFFFLHSVVILYRLLLLMKWLVSPGGAALSIRQGTSWSEKGEGNTWSGSEGERASNS